MNNKIKGLFNITNEINKYLFEDIGNTDYQFEIVNNWMVSLNTKVDSLSNSTLSKIINICTKKHYGFSLRVFEDIIYFDIWKD